MKPSTTLAKAREVISTPDKWTKGEFARNAEGNPYPYAVPDAACFCLLGALKKSSPNVDSYWDARDYLSKETGDGIVRFNDDPKRTHQEVIAALNKAIELALADGN